MKWKSEIIDEVLRSELFAMDKDQFFTPDDVNQIYHECAPFIRKAVRYCLGDVPAVDDVCQNIYLRLLEKPIPKRLDNLYCISYSTNERIMQQATEVMMDCINELPGDKSAVADRFQKTSKDTSSGSNIAVSLQKYLFRIAKNKAIDYIRERDSRENCFTKFTQIRTVKESKTPLQEMSAVNDICYAVRIIDELLPERLAVFLKLHVAGFTHEQIAEKTSSRIDTIKRQISRGRQLLKKLPRYKELMENL